MPSKTPSPEAAAKKRLLQLTIEQKRIGRAVDLERAVIAGLAHAEWQTTGVAPTWKVPGLGAIALDGCAAPDPEPVVADQAAFQSYVAERFPTETWGVIRVRADDLEKALEALGFADVEVQRTETEVRGTQTGAVLAGLTVVDLWEDEQPEAPDDETGRYVVVNDEGTEVPGVRVVQRPANPRLVVRPDAKAKQKAEAAADAEHLALHPEPETTDEIEAAPVAEKIGA